MAQEFVLNLDQKYVRFTPSGEITVIDAIKALSESDVAEEIWEALKIENPDILAHCRQFHFSRSKSAVVTDSQGWEIIETLLFNYILNHATRG